MWFKSPGRYKDMFRQLQRLQAKVNVWDFLRGKGTLGLFNPHLYGRFSPYIGNRYSSFSDRKRETSPVVSEIGIRRTWTTGKFRRRRNRSQGVTLSTKGSVDSIKVSPNEPTPIRGPRTEGHPPTTTPLTLNLEPVSTPKG